MEEYAASPCSASSKLASHIKGCKRCTLRLGTFQRRKAADREDVADFQPADPYDYGEAFARLERSWESLWSFYERERSEAPRLLARLADLPLGRQDLLVHNTPRFRSWGLFELLVHKSGEHVLDPVKSEELARLAIRISGELDPLQYGAAQIEDLRARAWAYIANSLRLRSELRKSQDAFEIALAHQRLGTGDAFERATLSILRASLLRDQRRFEEALGSTRRAVSLFAKIDDRRQLARAYIQMGTVYFGTRNLDESMRFFSEADALVEADEDPLLLLMLRHNRADVLIDLGRILEASRLLLKSQLLYREFSNPSIANRDLWIQAKLALASGRVAEAERLYRACNRGFFNAGMFYDAALVSKDLACLCAEQGRGAEAARLNEEAGTVFSSLQIEVREDLSKP